MGMPWSRSARTDDKWRGFDGVRRKKKAWYGTEAVEDDHANGREETANGTEEIYCVTITGARMSGQNGKETRRHPDAG